MDKALELGKVEEDELQFADVPSGPPHQHRHRRQAQVEQDVPGRAGLPLS